MAANKNTATSSVVPSAPTIDPAILEKLSKCDPFALQQLADFQGPTIFNPLIGTTPAETFNKFETALAAMSVILHEGDDIDPTQLCRGLEVMTDCLWAAAQYEAFRAMKASEAAA